MIIFSTALYVIMIICSIYMFRQVFYGKSHIESRSLMHFSLSALLVYCFIIQVQLVTNYKYAFFCYTMYYMAYTAAMFIYYWFSYSYCYKKKIKPFKSVIFYIAMIEEAVLAVNYFHPFLFRIKRMSFGSVMYWSSVAYTDLKVLIYVGWLICTAGVCWNMFFAIHKSPRIYIPRYLVVGIFTLVHTTYMIVSTVFYFPIWLKNIFLVPYAAMLIYFTMYYSDRAFKNSALLYATENLSDGFILFGEDNKLIYMNERLSDMLTDEQKTNFKFKDNFEKWINETTDLNGIFVKVIESDAGKFYFSVVSHEFRDKQAYIGISYNLQDVTSTVERLEIVEKANEELATAAHMKSDFLANMSHEIRTPMNAVIGLAEMSLREEMSDEARDYISQIKSSGKALLSIINDILDFSKIESGKMEIIPEEYALMSEINDVANTLMTRIGDKDIELTIEAAPDLPSRLYGDSQRLRQIIINLANNAIKFTNHGRVQIVLDYEKLSDDEIMLYFHVVDTGIGIRPEDKAKLFNSFQQVDTKRNRSIEGTGLGLAISKNLVITMGGSIDVDSEYGKGSDFHFGIPQKVLDWTPSIKVDHPDEIFAFGMWNKKYLARRFFVDTNRMRVFSAVLKSVDDFEYTAETYEDMLAERRQFLFFEEQDYTDDLKKLLSDRPGMIGVMLAEYTSAVKSDLPNLRVFKKPLSTLGIALALNNMELHSGGEESKAFEMDFIAPDARVLIVDDNTINLTIAEGLLSPLQLQIDTALSGKDAIEMVSKNHYDIVFMDHMMPMMDGVEATKIIRRTMPHLAEMPIIALTANAISGVKEFFLSIGMNDFIPKPIEVKDIVNKVRTWLPDEMIRKNIQTVSTDDGSDELPEIEGIEVKEAVRMLGSTAIYRKVLTQYYENIEENYANIKALFDNEDWENYTIKVHALKSSSRQIGAMELGDMAYVLEMAGHDNDIELIKNSTMDVLSQYLELKDKLSPICGSTVEKQYVEADPSEIISKLYDMKDACDDLDMDAMEMILETLETYAVDEEQARLIKQLGDAVSDVDVDVCNEIADKLIDCLT